MSLDGVGKWMLLIPTFKKCVNIWGSYGQFFRLTQIPGNQAKSSSASLTTDYLLRGTRIYNLGKQIAMQHRTEKNHRSDAEGLRSGAPPKFDLTKDFKLQT